jgi:hypothetical protein
MGGDIIGVQTDRLYATRHPARAPRLLWYKDEPVIFKRKERDAVRHRGKFAIPERLECVGIERVIGGHPGCGGNPVFRKDAPPVFYASALMVEGIASELRHLFNSNLWS